MFKHLFNPEFLKPEVLDFEILANFELAYRQLEKLYQSKGQEMPMEFEQFREKMYLLWEDKQRMPTDLLIAKLQMGDKWIKSNPVNKQYAENMMIYVSLVQELKGRGVSERQALKTKVKTRSVMTDVFGDLVEEE